MVVEFRKATTTPKEFSLNREKLKFSGEFKKIDRQLVELRAIITGSIALECNRCLYKQEEPLGINIILILCDGIYKNDKKDYDIIEFENSKIDFDYILQSEVESIKSEYFLCKNCEQISNFEQEY